MLFWVTYVHACEDSCPMLFVSWWVGFKFHYLWIFGFKFLVICTYNIENYFIFIESMGMVLYIKHFLSLLYCSLCYMHFAKGLPLNKPENKTSIYCCQINLFKIIFMFSFWILTIFEMNITRSKQLKTYNGFNTKIIRRVCCGRRNYNCLGEIE